MSAKFSGLNPEGPYLSLEKEKETFCVMFTCSVKRARFSFLCRSRATMAKKCAKNAMHVQSFCFTNIVIKLLALLPFSLPSSSLLPKLPFVVIQNFCYHGNVT